MKQVNGPINPILLSSLTILLSIFLGTIYFNIVQVAPYVEIQGFDDFNQVSVLDTTDSVKVVSHEITLEPHTWYRLVFTIDAIDGPSPIELHIDFFGGSSYDNPAQEYNQLFSNTTKSVQKTIYLNSDRSPESALLRFFYKSPSTISLSGISVEKVIIPIQQIQYIVIFIFISLLSLYLYCIRSNKVLFVGIMLSLFVFIVSIITFPPGSGDSTWNVPVGLSLIQEGNIDLNEYSELIELQYYYSIIELNGGYYNYFPIGGTIVPLPFIFVGHLLFGENLRLIELFSSKIMFIINVFFFYIFSWMLSRNIAISVILSSIFTFATPNLHILSGALWTHGSAELMIIFTLLTLLYRNYKQYDISYLSAIFLFLGYLARPTTALLIPIVFLYLIITRRRSAILFFGLGVACVGVYVLWSMATFGMPLPPYYAASRLSMETFSIALVGQLISPNRGLFIFSPFVIFSLYGMNKAIKDPNTDLIFKLLPLFVFIYMMIIAMFPHWWGGWSYGPRLYTDLMPVFVIYLYWAIRAFNNADTKYSSYVFIIVVIYCLSVQSF